MIVGSTHHYNWSNNLNSRQPQDIGWVFIFKPLDILSLKYKVTGFYFADRYTKILIPELLWSFFLAFSTLITGKVNV